MGLYLPVIVFLMLGIILHLPMRQIDLQKNLKKNADWLKFGFHGYGFDESETDRTYEAADSAELMLKDYRQVTKELCRITSEKI